MASTYIHHDYIAREALLQLKNNLVVGNLIHRGYEGEFTEKPSGWFKGDTINIKTPVYFRVKDGETIDVVDLKEQNTTLQLSYRKHVAWRCSSQDMTLNIDAFSRRFIQPAMSTLANYIDLTIMGVAKNFIPCQVGTPGTVPKDFLTYNLAKARLTDMAVPLANRSCVIDPTMGAYLSDTMKGVLNEQMTGPAIRENQLGRLAGFNIYESQNCPTHTCGTSAGISMACDLTVTDGDTTLTVDNASGDYTTTILAGDIFTFASTYAVNPISGQSTGYLRQFVSTTTATDAGTEGTVSSIPGVAPWPIYSETAGETDLPYQNIQTLPSDGDVMSIAGTASLQHHVGLAFHRDCIALAMVPLAMPQSATKKSQVSEDGFSLRVVQFYDGTNDVEYIRIDALFGIKVINPFMGCRIASA